MDFVLDVHHPDANSQQIAKGDIETKIQKISSASGDSVLEVGEKPEPILCRDKPILLPLIVNLTSCLKLTNSVLATCCQC